MRYLIGIDLGTTNTCVAYADTSLSHAPIQNFRIPQLKQAGFIDEHPTLPSYCYLATPNEWTPNQLKLPWKNPSDYFVGLFARDHGARVPNRLVCSAKSWLCHAGADRRDKILPFESPDHSLKISPVEASARYLLHIREAWNYAIAKGDVESEFEQQEIILTVPASFDEIARTLTLEAAKMAGYASTTLLEEPQAAFYSWIAQNEKSGMKELYPGACILVCDIGGGTTDFSLIEVVETQGKLSFQRLSVGDHLLLGGDNMDSALAHYLENKLKQQSKLECTPFQWLQLLHQVRIAKETLLTDNGPSLHRIVIQGEGSQIIKNTLAAEISREEIENLLLQGFWGQNSWEEAKKKQKGSGFRFIGLPYEEEPSITKHLAHFLSRSKDLKKPDFVLFNGGALKPHSFQKAVLQSLYNWFPEKNPKILESYHLDLAVARGAVYYGKVKKGYGVKIGGGTPRAYYLAVEDQNNAAQPQAITVVPRRTEEGASYELNQTFWVQPNTPVAFKMLSSNIRLEDNLGDRIPIEPQEMQYLPPIQTLLRFGKGSLSEVSKEKIPVHLGVALTPIGTLELWLKSLKTEHRWNLEFQIRKESGQENSLNLLDAVRKDETFDIKYLEEAKQILRQFYLDHLPIKSSQIMEHLEKTLERTRLEWPGSVLRSLWDELLKLAPMRKSLQEKEIRWWNLAGFLLRPGYGFPLDDFRIKELWKIILSEIKTRKSPDLLLQEWICYRRIAGGLTKGQQTQLASDLLPSLNKNRIEIKNKNDLYQFQEKIRLLASFEYLDCITKEKLGEVLLKRLMMEDYTSTEIWALGRIGARHPVYGSAAHVIPRETCSKWVVDLLEKSKIPIEKLSFLVGQLARKTKMREINLPDSILQKAQVHFQNTEYNNRLSTLLFEEGGLTQAEQNEVLGDHLPLGISWNGQII